MWESFSQSRLVKNSLSQSRLVKNSLSLLCPFLRCSNFHLPTVSRKLCTQYSVASGTSLRVTGILGGSTRPTAKKTSGQKLFIGRSEREKKQTWKHRPAFLPVQYFGYLHTVVSVLFLLFSPSPFWPRHHCSHMVSLPLPYWKDSTTSLWCGKLKLPCYTFCW